HRTIKGMSHVPEDRHKYGLVLDYTLAENLVLQTYFEPMFQNRGFIKEYAVNAFAEMLIQDFDIRSPLGRKSIVRLMSGGNQQKAIIAREFSRDSDLIIAVQPTRGLDVGAIEYIHGKLIEIRNQGGAVLVISLELDEVFNLADRIIVMYEGEVVGELDPKTTTENELGLYMSGSKRS
ncbi:MAG: heme ABC transporter ATP-binding protein, partial [Acholeplasmataceae bacterium]|nr:heme ABC transporter ATP-binding protein [Acholeplasmataceae bacterium]